MSTYCRHEYISGYYRISVYFLSKLLADFIPMRSLPGIIFTCIAYFMIGFQPKIECFFIMLITLMMISYTAASLALAIAVGHSVTTLSNLVTSIIFIFMSIFSGVLINLKTIQVWLAWLKYLSIHRYGLNALQINEFVGLTFCSNLSRMNDEICARDAMPILCTGEDYLELQDIEVSTWGLWYNLVALASLSLIFLTIAYLKLHFMKKSS